MVEEEEVGDAAADDDDEEAGALLLWCWWLMREYNRVIGGRLTALNTSTNTPVIVFTVVTCHPGSNVKR